MKKFMMFLLAGLSCMALACSDDDDVIGGGQEGGGDEGGGDKTPTLQVTFSDITSSTFTASWGALEGATAYRYEVTSKKDGQVSAIAAENTTDLSFTLTGLTPSTEYTVKMVAKAGDKILSDWFVGTVTTEGQEEVTFTITPYERYYKGNYIYPYADIKVSNPDVHYWVSAIPANNEMKPADWIKEDIQYYLDRGLKWDDLVTEGLILKGDTESLPFVFNGYDHYYFIVAQVNKTMTGLSVGTEVARSYRFWYESQDTQMKHESTYDQFVGEWLLQTTGTANGTPDSEVNIDDVKEEFPVTITASEDKKSLLLKGFGGSRNLFADVAIKMDYEPAADNYNAFGISFPQEIKAENDVVWKYVSWYNFNGTVGNEEVHTYLPYDDKMHESMPSWAKGFSGFIGNLNRTVIKICPQSYIDGNYEGAYMMSMWPYGISKSGNVEQDKLMNDKHAEPVGPYCLVRKDVADGLALQLPDTGVEEVSAKALKASEQAQSAKTPREAYSIMR